MVRLFISVLLTVYFVNAMSILPTDKTLQSGKVVHLNQINTIKCVFDGHRSPVMVYHNNEKITPTTIRTTTIGYPEGLKKTEVRIRVNTTHETAAGKYECVADGVVQTYYRAIITPLLCEHVDNETICHFNASYYHDRLIFLHISKENALDSIDENGEIITKNVFTITFQNHYDEIQVIVYYMESRGYLSWRNITHTTKMPPTIPNSKQLLLSQVIACLSK